MYISDSTWVLDSLINTVIQKYKGNYFFLWLIDSRSSCQASVIAKLKPVAESSWKVAEKVKNV